MSWSYDKSDPPFAWFSFDETDGLAMEHIDICNWMSAAGCGFETKLADNDQGRRILDADPATAVHYVLASIVQARHWEDQLRQIIAKAPNDHLRSNFQLLPGGNPAHTYHNHAVEVVRTLLRRKLPLSIADCTLILDWVLQIEPNDLGRIPLRSILLSIQRLKASTEFSPQFSNKLVQLTNLLYRSADRKVVKHATLAKQLSDNCSEVGRVDASEFAPSIDSLKATPSPSIVGMPGVLLQLKRLFGIPCDEISSSAARFVDGFPIDHNSPLAEQHNALNRLFEDMLKAEVDELDDLTNFIPWRKIATSSLEERGMFLLASMERQVHALLARGAGSKSDWHLRWIATLPCKNLLGTPVRLPRDGLFDLALYASACVRQTQQSIIDFVLDLLKLLETQIDSHSLSEGERFALSCLRSSTIYSSPLGRENEITVRLTKWISDGARFCLVPGETWTDQVNQDFTLMNDKDASHWTQLWSHSLLLNGKLPSHKWTLEAQTLLEKIGYVAAEERLLKYLTLVSQPATHPRLPQNTLDFRSSNTVNPEIATCLRSLLWLITMLPQPDRHAESIRKVAEACYEEVPEYGPRMLKAGNAAVNVLEFLRSPKAILELKKLENVVAFPSVQKNIRKVLAALN